MKWGALGAVCLVPAEYGQATEEALEQDGGDPVGEEIVRCAKTNAENHARDRVRCH